MTSMNADYSGSCRGIMTPCQIDTIVTFVTMMAWKYEDSKGKANNLLHKLCLVDSCNTVLDMICCYTKCSRSGLITDVIDCFDVDIVVKDALRKAFENRDPGEVRNVEAPLDKIIETLFCFLARLIGKVLLGNTLNKVLSELSIVLGPAVNLLATTIGGFVGLTFTPLLAAVNGLLFTVTATVGGVLNTVTSLVSGIVNAVG
ncbi:hypothetical protein GDO78_016341 [Eleutherodactylus coqui]|uniref:Uncharacterized protein n=1 Tax=Eleutherodactylus coqui TaxID=57060 RepID=A0A8J6BMK1_ELECQ|nr:hypothetical protein GDO78_016341 [Eleutherodactylus coqui]